MNEIQSNEIRRLHTCARRRNEEIEELVSFISNLLDNSVNLLAKADNEIKIVNNRERLRLS
jgi:hypothetical protein